MAGFNLDDVTKALSNTHVSPNGVSFAGEGLKLNTEEDVKTVVEAINNCPNMNYLNLEGNTLGVEASKFISTALEGHSEFKRALWKDMFTGRMKTEIPKAIEYLGAGLIKADARLTELDLSDNAFGPIGVKGLAAFLQSPCCFALQELRLNNNGLGITGCGLLATALLDCHKFSKQAGKPLALKVFIAGRNRLENDGAILLSEVFKTIGTLEEIAMPQNGIYHVGITALSEALKHNKQLEILNLNDNTIGPKGATAISNALLTLENLREINFGDCLLKSSGVKQLAIGLINCKQLEEINLGFNEIKADGATELIEVLGDKKRLKSVNLDGNQFGEGGKTIVRNLLQNIGKFNCLGSLSEDEGDDDDSNDDSNDSNVESSDSHEEEAEEAPSTQFTKTAIVGVETFLSQPTCANFAALGFDRETIVLEAATINKQNYIETFVPILMKVSSIATTDGAIEEKALKTSELLYRELFTWAKENEKMAAVHNALLVNLGLIKSEDKKYKPSWELEGCLKALRTIINKNYIPEATRDTFKVFMQREIANNSAYLIEKKQLLDKIK